MKDNVLNKKLPNRNIYSQTDKKRKAKFTVYE